MITEAWRETRLGYLVEIRGGMTPSKDELRYWDGDVPWVSAKDMKIERIDDSEDHVTTLALVETGLGLIPPESVLLVVRGMILAHTLPVAVTAVPLTINQDMKALLPGPDVRAEFLAWWLRGHASWMLEEIAETAAHGTKAIRLDLLKSLKVRLPDADLQSDIVAFLACETAKLDRLVAEQQRLIALLREKRQAVVSNAVTNGMNPDVRMKSSGLEWLQEVPAHWDVLALKHLASDRADSFTDGDWVEAPFITDEGIRLVQTGNVGIGSYKEQGFRYISEDTFRQLRCTEVQAGDILICRLDGPVGRACLAPDLGVRMITSVDNTILKVKESVNASYVVALLSSEPWLSWMESLCRVGGGHRLRISRSMLGEIRVPLPPAKEQQDIATRISAIMAEHEALITEAERAIVLLQERRAALITAAVTGKIDVRSHAPTEAVAA